MFLRRRRWAVVGLDRVLCWEQYAALWDAVLEGDDCKTWSPTHTSDPVLQEVTQEALDRCWEPKVEQFVFQFLVPHLVERPFDVPEEELQRKRAARCSAAYSVETAIACDVPLPHMKEYCAVLYESCSSR